MRTESADARRPRGVGTFGFLSLIPVLAAALFLEGEDTTSGGAGEDTTAGGAGDDQFDKDRALATIRKQRESEEAAKRQAAEARKELDEVKAQLKKFEDTDLSEREKASKRIAELESEKAKFENALRETRARQSLKSAASKANAIDADAVSRLVDIKAVEFGDDGEPKNASELIKSTKEAHPVLFGKGSADGGPRGETANGSKSDMNTLLHAAARGR